jgi:hypothetical protein
MSDKLNIANEMRELDRKNRNFYRDLTPEERKKFSNYLMIRWASGVQGARELQEFYVIATNERLNKHFFSLGKLPDLQWLCATTVSPDLGAQRHQWISPRKREPGASSVKKQLSNLFPHFKSDEIDLLAEITTKKELAEYIRQHGQEQ